MAQYTPNFNLYKPDTSDDFADFRAEHNNNMDIIDQNLGGGGGSGGHTIYDKDGNALAQESGLQFTGNVNVSDDSGNGRTVVDILGGGGNVYGAFIDTDRVIASGSFAGSFSYTATEDSFAVVGIVSDNSSEGKIYVDGVVYTSLYNTGGSSVHENVNVYLRKGQVMSITEGNGGWTVSYAVYGLKQGTNGIFAPVIYSDNERVIGVWRDNKPLYQRTFVLSSPITVNGSGTLLPNDIQTALADVEIMVDSECARDSTYSAFISPYVYKSGGQWYILSADNWGNVKFITLRYTKTTDNAGSGNWNTDGVPTHHYSTSEQVVGTWTNGKPCYEITLEGSGSYASNIEHIISIPLNADNVRIMSGFVDIGTDWLPISLTLGLGTGTTNGIYCYPNKSNGLHLFSSAWTFTNYSIVIQYTKTTD